MAKIMSTTSYKKIATRFGVEPVCRYCGNPIRIGQRYYSPEKKTHGKRYHWTCAEGLSIV
ncbi:hypothetical protein NTE_01261 [Candidatus Nitrososphaera evergladensis SR1]|uniref:Uncharacterized protein n=1 Tax=Candidatus Nitrososphaera evergladensis SR1 TaxID=1459636 RepID=A0A075MQH5_9ARCH|nr:hypothetical protein NTE_01261 [Candidatus Nitrososphaera evergladensis SR1]